MKIITAHLNKSKNIRKQIDIRNQLGSQLEFPGWCGSNWDALLDCLSGLTCLDTEECKCIIVLHNANQLKESHPDLFSGIVRLVKHTQEEWEGYPRSIKI